MKLKDLRINVLALGLMIVALSIYGTNETMAGLVALTAVAKYIVEVD